VNDEFHILEKGNPMRLTKALKTTVVTFGVLGTAAVMNAQDAYAYDMDCKVILCIAGGFPTGCADAYSYMIKRITRFPNPLPPFGFCAMSDGSEYKAHNVDYRYLRDRDAYDCPEGKKLFYRREESDSGNVRETAFCYTRSERKRIGWGDDDLYQTIYHGRSAATPVNFELKITIEPGTEVEFKSPLFRINWNTGYLAQRQS
jgi:hypothetical protein